MRARPKNSPHRSAVLASHAREMRWAPTASEARLWHAIRRRQLGVAFRRQVGIGSYIADFVAREARLVVEVDGGYHAGRKRADARRDEAFGLAGYRVLRVEAESVHRDLTGVLARIRAALHAPE